MSQSRANGLSAVAEEDDQLVNQLILIEMIPAKIT